MYCSRKVWFARIVSHHRPLADRCNSSAQADQKSMNSCKVMHRVPVFILGPEFLKRVDSRHVFPTTVERLRDRRHTDVINDSLPIERIQEFRRLSLDSGNIVLCGSSTVFGTATPSLGAEGNSKELYRLRTTRRDY